MELSRQGGRWNHFRYDAALPGLSRRNQTTLKRRWDEAGQPYRADADDACYGILQLKDGIIAQIMCSWCVHRDHGDRWHRGLRLRRLQLLLDPATHGDAEGAMESRCGEAGRFLHRLAAPAGDRTLRQRIPSPMGAILARRRRRLTIPCNPCRPPPLACSSRSCRCRGGKNANGLMFPTSRHKRRHAKPVAR